MINSIRIGDKSIERQQGELGQKVWPEFMQHDQIVAENWALLYTDFLRFQAAIYANNKMMGVANAIPLFWDDDFQNLPIQGLDWAIKKSINDHKNGLLPNLLIGAQILINPTARNTGLSYDFLDLMKLTARKNGIEHLALPVRPTLKHLYPLIPMKEYLKWSNEKGEPFDPWIRVHLKAGGHLISVCNESMRIRGKVEDWQKWTGLSFQSSGLYTIKNALSPVEINLEENFGEYVEPNVWITHQA